MSVEKMIVLHEPSDSSPFLVVFKPAGIPSAPLFEGDESILTESIKLFPEISLVHGKKEVEHGLVHRIDTETQGLVLIATTQESYDNLILFQKDGKFEKWYRAKVDYIGDAASRLGSFPPLPQQALTEKFMAGKEKLVLESAFRPFGKKGREVRPVTQESGRAAVKKGGEKAYQTEILLKDEGLALCRIKAGYRHQVRCHLAWCGLPVQEDLIYNPLAKEKSENSHDMKFTAYKISFPHPLTAEPQIFELQD